ncbi:EI24 domain-containing protein [Saccharothrix sp. ST-888]|uniref:EI24 domain-containing protein n=1 Tax=Saccharothrix sp. ST-888 TaxID=1427391 RepID=UPI0005EC5F53|nr:EI24 domain-containing protein [Saccharothrix sp. ST-888]KJK54836.1 membrane protein [Saccharothrix sp. ST-888]
MRDFAAGVGLLFKGQRWVAGRGRWWGFGMIPALIALVGYVVALTALAVWSGDLARWATPFADGWGSPWQGLLRGVFVAALIGGGLLLAMVSFTAVTLLIGQPFYESLAAKVDETGGGVPAAPGQSLWRELVVAAGDSLRVLVRVAGIGLLLFLCGFVPVVGQTVVPVVGMGVSGFFLAVELTAVALQRRGIPQRERIRLLRGRLGLALGFGVPLALLALVPVLTVVVMPGAVAGATLLARELLPAEPAVEEAAAEPDPENAAYFRK